MTDDPRSALERLAMRSIESQLPGGVCGLHVGGRVRAALAGKDDVKLLVKVRG